MSPIYKANEEQIVTKCMNMDELKISKLFL